MSDRSKWPGEVAAFHARTLMIPKRAINLTGMKFGRLAVIGFTAMRGRKTLWQCVCSCGKKLVVLGNSLRSGNTQSCGCLRVAMARQANTTHGETPANKPPTKEYQSWYAMKDRVGNPNNKAFKNYGGRGIKICQRWIHSYENFLSDMGRRPINCTLERKDVNGDYTPENCRWATKLEQAQNMRTVLRISHAGKTMSASAWARETGIHLNTIRGRFHRGMAGSGIFAK